MSEHLFEKENTIFERDILFSLKGIKWGKDFDINDNTYPVDDLRENNIFLEGVSSYLGIDADDVDAIINETEKRYNNKGIEFTKTVRQWLQGKKKPSQSQAYRHNCYDFCIALGMNINETFEFMFKHFQIYYFVSCYYWSKIRRDLKRKKPKYTRSEHLINDLDYDYLEKTNPTLSSI